MSLLALFQACEQSALGQVIQASSWLFPIIEGVHLVGLGVTAGAVLIVDLRLLGLGPRQQPVAELARDAEPWLFGSLTLMFASGIPLAFSEATKCYYSVAFWVKMISLLLAILFTLTVRRHVTRSGLTSSRPQLAKVTALISLVLWFGVGWGGRWIGFS